MGLKICGLFLYLLFLMIVIAGVGSVRAGAGMDLIYQLPEMGQVSFSRDIVYKDTEDRELKMDIYYPLGGRSSKAQTVVLVHGIGPVRSYKDTAAYRSWGRLLAVKGFNAITFNWRPGDSPEDVGDLINFVRNNRDRLKLTGERINVFAFSAGVKESIPEILAVDRGFIQSIVVYYGELADSILNGDWKYGLPPFFIAMAGRDKYIPEGCNEDFVARARQLGYSVTYLVHKTGRHGFEIYNNNPETREIIDKTIEFIRSRDI